MAIYRNAEEVWEDESLFEDPFAGAREWLKAGSGNIAVIASNPYSAEIFKTHMRISGVTAPITRVLGVGQARYGSFTRVVIMPNVIYMQIGHVESLMNGLNRRANPDILWL